MRLYDYPASANSFKVRLALAHLRLPYERVELDLFAGDTLSPEHLARNPAARVPVLVLDDGRPIAESAAILLWVAEGTPLLPDDRYERAQVHRWLFFEQNHVEPNLGTARFWTLTGRDAQRPEAFARYREAAANALEVLERHLDGREFLTDRGFTVADIALYGYVHAAGDVGFTLGPATRAWVDRVEAQPGHHNDLAPYPAVSARRRGGRAVDPYLTPRFVDLTPAGSGRDP